MQFSTTQDLPVEECSWHLDYTKCKVATNYFTVAYTKWIKNLFTSNEGAAATAAS